MASARAEAEEGGAAAVVASGEERGLGRVVWDVVEREVEGKG